MNLKRSLSTVAAWLAVTACGAALAGDWPHWRGPLQTGYATDTHLPSAWSQEGQNLLWHSPVGGGRTAPIVLDGRVYMINRAGEEVINIQERVVCIDLETGRTLWEDRFNVFETDIVAHRVGWANLAGDPETGNIYAHGVSGIYTCYSRDGELLWEKSLTEEFGRIAGYGGRIMSPIVDGDLVILSFMSSGWGPHGRPVHRFFACDKRTGEPIWWSEPSGQPQDTVQSVPVIATVDGVRVLFDTLADGAVHALKVGTGEPIWRFSLSKRGLNTSAVYHDGVLYATHSEENFDTTEMGAIVAISVRGSGDITDSGELWRTRGISVGYASPLYHDGLLYVADNAANLHCLDATNGEVLWSFNYGSTGGRGSPVMADGNIYIGEVGGTFHVLEASRAGCKRLDSETFRKPDGSPIEIYGTAAVVDGKVLLPTLDDLYCIGLPEGKAGTYPDPAAGGTGETGAPSVLRVVPAETWVDAGKTQAFRARVYDDKGNFLETVSPAWSVKGVTGSIGPDGTFEAENVNGMQAGVVEATLGDLQASARLRVIPELPYTEDFEGLQEGVPPPGWITSRLKSRVEAMDGNKVLRKLADRSAPPFARLRCYITPSLDTGYSVQADMYGQSKRGRFLPDMGLLNSRYRMILLGTTRPRSLRLVTWDPMPRLQVDVPFDWQPDTWYTMKLSVEERDGQGLVRGKVWPQGAEEPEAWSIEMVDPHPNLRGSAGLYAYSVAITEKSPGTEVYFDNVAITRNK